jgi:hypothetical protein
VEPVLHVIVSIVPPMVVVVGINYFVTYHTDNTTGSVGTEIDLHVSSFVGEHIDVDFPDTVSLCGGTHVSDIEGSIKVIS